jgi:tetratricopeptide (TPR) repeat protein
LLSMRFRALRGPQQRYLLGRFRGAVDAARLDSCFEAGERLLDLEPTTAAYEELLRPVDREISADAHLRRYDLLRELEREDRTVLHPWRLLLRVALLVRLGWYMEALALSADFEHLPERYGWMRYARAMLLLNHLQAYDGARRELEATLRAAPAFWKAQGQLAECLLCQGREAEAFALMDQCVDQLAASSAEQNEAATWRGELHLWLGRYDAALADLDPCMASGSTYALIWGGAAHLLRGEHDRALLVLDRAVQAAPRDAEVYVWRGEAYERLGHPDRAVADFDRAVGLTGPLVWPCAGRALARAATGDTAAAIADFMALPARTRTFFEWRTGTPVDRNPHAVVEVLLEMRKAARGIRRSEQYLEVLWMKRS